MNPPGVIASGVAVVAFALTYVLLRSKSVRLRAALFFAFAVLSIPSVLFVACYLPSFPQCAWFYELRSWRGTEFFAVFVGCAFAIPATFAPRPTLFFPLFATIALTIAPYLKPLIVPLPDKSFQTRWQGDVCLQGTPTTCGPASVVTILRNLGVKVTEYEVARGAYSTSSGTEAWYLARYIRGKGLGARFEFRETFSPEVGLPAMVGVRLGVSGHFIAVLSVKEGEVTFADPLRGLETVPKDEFRRRYKFSGFHMVVSAPVGE